MARRFRGFVSVRDAEVPLGLKNDLRELEAFLKTLDDRVAGLDGSEPLGASPSPGGGSSNPNMRPHAVTHSRSQNDQLGPYSFTWENDHLFALTYTQAVANSKVPVTIRKIGGQLTDLLLVQDEDLVSMFTIDDEGRAAVKQSGATLNAWFTVKNTLFNEVNVAALNPVLWIDANDPADNGSDTSSISDGTVIESLPDGHWTDKGSTGGHVTSSNAAPNMPTWYNTAGASPRVTTLPNSKPYVSTIPGAVGTDLFTEWSGTNYTIYAVYYQNNTVRIPIGSKSPSGPGNRASIVQAQSTDDTVSEPGIVQYEHSSSQHSWTFLGTSSGVDEWVWGKWLSTGVMEIDGVSMPVNSTTGSPGTFPLKLQTWFSWTDNAPSYHPNDGFFAEVLVFDSVLTSTQQANIEAYLEGKWGVNGGGSGSGASGPFIQLLDTANNVDTEFDELGQLHIGGENPSAAMHATSITTDQGRFAYDSSNYFTINVDFQGNVTFNVEGTNADFTFSDPLNIATITSPQLHVEYGASSFVNVAVTTDTGSIDFGDAGDADIGRILYYHAFDAMEIYCGAVDIMFCQSTYVSMNVPILAFGDVYWSSLTTGSRITQNANGLYIEPDINDDERELYILSGTQITSKNASVPVLHLDGDPTGQTDILTAIDDNDLEVFKFTASGIIYGYDGINPMHFKSQTDDDGFTAKDSFIFESTGDANGKLVRYIDTLGATVLTIFQDGRIQKDDSGSSEFMYEGGQWTMPSGGLTFNDNINLNFGSGSIADVQYYFNATDMVMDTVTGSAFRMQVNSSDIAVFDASEFDSLVPIIWNKQSTPSTPASNKGVVYLDTADSILKIRHDDGSVVNLENGSVATPFDIYMTEKIRNATDTLHGGLAVISTGNALNSGAPIVDTVGLGKVMFDINAGSVLTGSITITGTSVDRESGVETGSDTDVLTIDGLTTGTGITATDANGEIVADFANAYISSKWFRGQVTISTTDLTITNVDVYQVAFEQHDDQTEFSLDTLDVSAYSTNGTTAFISVHLYSLEVTGSTCSITAEADAVLTTAEIDANKWYRLRRGNIQKTLDGSTDGFWCDLVLGPGASVYWENINAKVWTLSPLSGVVAVGGAGSFSPGTTYDWTSDQNVSDTTEWRFGNSQDMTIQHDGTDNLFTSNIANGAAANAFKFYWNLGAEPNATSKLLTVGFTDAISTYDHTDFLPWWSAPWSVRDGNALIVNDRVSSSLDASFIGFKSTGGQYYGMFRNGNATSMQFYSNSAFAFGTVGGGLQLDYKLDFSGTSGSTKSSIFATRERVNANSSLFYSVNVFDDAHSASQLFHTWCDRDSTAGAGYNPQFMIFTEASGAGVSLIGDGKLRFDSTAGCTSIGVSTWTAGDTYLVYDVAGSTLDMFVDGSEMFNADTTASRFLTGLVIPSGTTPAPNEEGAIFLDSTTTNGTLKMYSNGAWRTVVAW